MHKKKSFRLNHAQNAKSEGKLFYEYSSKKACWMKYIAIVLLISFVLLLILSNMDFSDESYLSTTAVSTVRSEEVSVAALNATNSTDNLASANIINDTITEELNFLESSVEAGSERAGVTCTYNNSCKSVICTGGPIYSLTYQLEDFIPDCGNNYLDLILENCTFNGSAIGQYTMSGMYKLSSLTIRNCTLETIVSSAFKQKTVQNLVNLTLHGTQLQTLNAKSFEGLETVKHFALFNVQQNELTPLKAQNFLQPLAGNLSSLVLQQSQTACNNHITYDPTEWLSSNAAFLKLTFVDLSGTQFNDTLNASTFTNLLAVEQLILANCSLHTIAEGTFDVILATLNSLDLRDNQLQILDGDFLAAAATTGISIQLAGNLWRCECDNQAVMDYVKQSLEMNSECASPTHFAGTKVCHVKMDCNESTTIAATSTSTASSTTNATTTTDSTASSTTKKTTTTLQRVTETMEMTDTTTSLLTTTTQPTTVTDTTTPLLTTIETTTEALMTSAPPYFKECYSSMYPRFIYCEGPIKEKAGAIPLCDYDALFNVEAMSSTSVQLQFDSKAYGLRVAYFQAMLYNSTLSVDIKTNKSLDIYNLSANQSYVFCLIQTNSSTTSPFNCRSAHLPLAKAIPWLVNGDKVLFYTLATILTLICCLLGMAAGCWLLRYRPTLVRGNKRLRRMASTSHEVMFFAKPLHRSSVDSTQFAFNELSKMRSSISDTLTSENYLSTNSYDFMQYLKGLEMNREPKVIYISENRPPLSRAPTFLPQANGKCGDERRDDCYSKPLRQQSSQCRITPKQGDLQSIARFRMCQQNTTALPSENVYESLDYYQELY